MTTVTVTPPGAAAISTDRSTRLLAAAVAGPTFVAVSLAQVPFRDGFDLSRHAFSFLLNGRGSWVQVANFVLLGSLFLATATGLRTVVAGRRGTAAAVLAGLLGAGQVVAGLFAPDGAYGYPPGAPDGMPSDLSVGSLVHGLAFGVSMMCWLGLLVVLASALRTEHPRWAIGCALTAGSLLVVAGVSGHPHAAIAIYAVVTPAFAFTSALLVHLRSVSRRGGTVG